MKRKTRAAVLALLSVGALAIGGGIASATVTFDLNTGKGFIGKGDVQNVFTCNNGQLQSNASGVSFTYNATDTYSATCTFVTGTGRGEKTYNVDIPRHTG